MLTPVSSFSGPGFDHISSVTAGHPTVSKAAVFDIITPDLLTGPSAAAAEAISIVNDCLNKFANLGQQYEIHISHSKSQSFCIPV